MEGPSNYLPPTETVSKDSEMAGLARFRALQAEGKLPSDEAIREFQTGLWQNPRFVRSIIASDMRLLEDTSDPDQIAELTERIEFDQQHLDKLPLIVRNSDSV
ncbi:MAG TPA: hypothetical protein VMR34_06105 [Candidatus Saccharimonadales bacterium]|nr:hypothetical protein [Candidatus Saccharimonadales bacterium]